MPTFEIEILSYLTQKLDQLCQEYGPDRVKKAVEKIKMSWPELLLRMRNAFEKQDLGSAKKIIDEHLKDLLEELIKSFN